MIPDFERFDARAEDIYRHYGALPQFAKLGEESGELSTACARLSAHVLRRVLNGDEAAQERETLRLRDQIGEEIADTLIMIEQIVSCSPGMWRIVRDTRERKLRRQIDRIKAEQKPEGGATIAPAEGKR